MNATSILLSVPTTENMLQNFNIDPVMRTMMVSLAERVAMLDCRLFHPARLSR
jgi:hypothetical protein